MATKGRYQKIVVPVDGSRWSERAIPHAIDIARNNDAEIILLHIFRPPAQEFLDSISLGGAQDQIEDMREQSKQYLYGLQESIRAEHVKCRAQMIEGMGVANLICDHIRDEKPDLVIMTTHGRTGISRFLFGSVAHKVVQEIDVPVLLIRPDQGSED